MSLAVKRLFVVLTVCSLFAAACSDGGDPLDPIEVGSTTTTTTTTATTTSTTETTVESDPESLAETWTALFEASGLPVEERAPAIALLGPAVPTDFGEVVAAIVDELQVSEVWPHPIVNIRFDGVAEIHDCMIYDPSLNGFSTVYIEGKAEPDGDGGWKLTDYDRIRDGCIPGPIEDAILADYAHFQEAAIEFNDPPDPDHPLLAETLTGDLLDSARETQASFQDSGYVLKIDHESHPEVTALYRNDVAIVRDCLEIGPDRGLFDAEGNLVDSLTPSTEAGKRDTISYRMNRENGIWKLAEFEGTQQLDTDCQFPPTPLGLERIE